MPEGDSVYRATARLHQGLAGEVLLASTFRVPALATVDLQGYTVKEVVPRGKHLLMRLLAPPVPNHEFSQPPMTLHSHLLMEGRCDLYSPTDRWSRPAHTARVILKTAKIHAVGFDFAQVKLVRSDQET